MHESGQGTIDELMYMHGILAMQVGIYESNKRSQQSKRSDHGRGGREQKDL